MRGKGQNRCHGGHKQHSSDHCRNKGREHSGRGGGRKRRGRGGRHGHNADLYQSGDRLVLKINLPGIQKDDLKLFVDEDVVTVGTEQDDQTEERHYLWTHRRGVPRERSYHLPHSVDPDEVDAKLENGVLTVRMGPSNDKPGREVNIS